MIKKLVIFLLFLFFTFNPFARDEETLLTIGNTKVSKAEYERIYRKNNNNLYNPEDKKSPQEYLELYINFKLKVLEAEALKMDTNSVFINELKGYRKELAAPYLTNVEFNEQLVRELYDRMTKEVNASHILLRVNKNVTEEEEQKVLNKINKIRKEIIEGKDFGEAAVQYSEDPSAKMNKGNLNYFSAFQMVAPFENAAFSTPVGEISEPVRSSFGYHLLKVHDIRKNRGEIKVAQIMKAFPKDATPDVKEKLKKEINDIYIELQNGADFAELAKTKSDDKNSAVKGGEMQWFAAGRLVKEFSEPAFALKNNGDYTPPVKTAYGYHIIKKLDHRSVPSFEKSKQEIENRIKNDPARSITSKTAFIDKLKREYNYSENIQGIANIKGKSIESEFQTTDFEIFRIDNKIYSLNEFQRYIQKEEITTGTYSSNFNQWVEFEITQLEDSKLEEKYPEFRYLMQEYHDGILLFNISEEKIWNYAVEDSAGLDSFYKKNKKKHLWEERFKGRIIRCKDQVTRDEAEKLFAAEIPTTEILDRLNTEEERISLEEGAWEKGNNAIVDYYVWEGTEPEDFDSDLTFIRGNLVEPEPKTLEEARGLYISDYQNYLEKMWLKQLRKKYKVRVNKKLLKTIESV